MSDVVVFMFAAVTLMFSILRFVVPVSGKVNRADIFKDLAHIWVGVLLGAAIATGNLVDWVLPTLITVVEVVAFIARKK